MDSHIEPEFGRKIDEFIAGKATRVEFALQIRHFWLWKTGSPRSFELRHIESFDLSKNRGSKVDFGRQTIGVRKAQICNRTCAEFPALIEKCAILLTHAHFLLST